MDMVFVMLCAFVTLSLSVPGKSFTIPVASIPASRKTRSLSPPSENVCTTPSCVEIAKTLRLAINSEADPCDDFFEYACGSWRRLNPIPEYRSMNTGFTELAHQIMVDLKSVMNNLNASAYKEKSIQLVADMYKKCMDEETIERVGAEPLKREINAIFGTVSNETGHTFISRASSSSSFLEDLAVILWFRHGIDVLVSLSIVSDPSNRAPHIFNFDQAPLALGMGSEDYYLKHGEPYRTVRSAYLTMMSNISMLLWNTNSSEPTERQIKHAQDILDFEIQLAKINTPSIKRRNPTRSRNIMKIHQLKSFGEIFNLTRYINHFAPMEEVNIEELDYLRKLNLLLGKSDVNVVKGYFLWMLIFKRLKFVSREFVNTFYAFTEVYVGLPRNHDRSRVCVKYLIEGAEVDGENLGMNFRTVFAEYAVGRLFEDHFKRFNNHTQQEVEEIIDHLIGSFRMMLYASNWMDEVTKVRAYEKLDMMSSTVGYSETIMSDLDSMYARLLKPTENSTDIQIMPSDGFYEMNTKLNVWRRKTQNLRIGKMSSYYSFAGSPIQIIAGYSQIHNSIMVPAGILQSPCYDPGFPMAINFGCIGFMIGHEITHGFYDIGSHFDGDGKLVNWWTTNSKQNFNKKAKCMIDQYSKFCYPELGEDICVNGIKTQGENIADNAGVLLAFHAYKNYMMDQPDLILPTFENFTQEQMFFLSYAYTFRSVYRNEELMNRLSTQIHAPGRERVNGPCQNLREFSEAFNCPTNCRMNPQEKCTIW